MAEGLSQEPSYTMGYSEEFLQILDRRSAQSHAGNLLPHLKTGDRVFDFGCGPGTITVGLAKAVEPGEVHGLDMEESQVKLAQAAAEAGGHTNATFHVGDVTALPFEDDFFDAAHCHAVLMHVPDTPAVLSEVMRVLKPGGLAGCRELLVSSCFLEPSIGDVVSAWNVFAGLLAANGAHPEMGRELNATFLHAGFSDVTTSASFDYFGTDSDVAFLRAFIDDWFYLPEVVAAVLKYGFATQQQLDDWRVALDEWKATPGACGGLSFGEILARNPHS